MYQPQLKTPVVFMVFNRPDQTRQVFEQIRQARPSKLFVVADGPRDGFEDDLKNCYEVRKIFDSVDWPCEVIKDYSEKNLGCGIRIASGISRVFEQTDAAIILEDDCVPNQSFFRFCADLLERYRHDDRIMHISGSNCQIVACENGDSYYFSRIPYCWGWATWRRAWKYYDFEMRILPDTIINSGFAHVWSDKKVVRYWSEIFRELYYAAHKKTWDYQWTFTCLKYNGFSVVPNENLVSNVGFATNGTHTKKANHFLAALPTSSMEFPLRHPNSIVCNEKADYLMHRNVFGINKLNDLIRIIKNCIRGDIEAC